MNYIETDTVFNFVQFRIFEYLQFDHKLSQWHSTEMFIS